MKIGFVQKLKKEVFHLQTLVEQKSFTENLLVEQSAKSAISASSSQSGMPLSIIPMTSNTSGESLNSSLEFNATSAATGTQFSVDSPGSIQSSLFNNSSGGGSIRTNSHSVVSSLESSISSLKNVHHREQSTTNLFGQMSLLDPLGLAFASIDGSSHRPSSSNRTLESYSSRHLLGKQGEFSEVNPSESMITPSPIDLELLGRYGSNLDSSDSYLDSYENLSNWSVLTFYLLTIPNSTGKTDSFLDAYFAKIWPKIPLFNKSWLADNMVTI